MTRAALVLLALLAPAQLAAQDWTYQPPLPFDVTRHWHTQVGHGIVTGATGALGGWIAGDTGAKVGSGVATVVYALREVDAHVEYAIQHAAGKLTRAELDKALWDSKMDILWPMYAATVVWTWEKRRDAWPWWLAGGAALVWVTIATDPGGMVNGMH